MQQLSYGERKPLNQTQNTKKPPLSYCADPNKTKSQKETSENAPYGDLNKKNPQPGHPSAK